MIPAANVGHLMLRDDVVEAAAQGRFHVHAVEDVDGAIELLTGMPAAEPDRKGEIPPGTIDRLVAARLAQMSAGRQAYGAGGGVREAPQWPRRLPAPLSVAHRWSRRRRSVP